MFESVAFRFESSRKYAASVFQNTHRWFESNLQAKQLYWKQKYSSRMVLLNSRIVAAADLLNRIETALQKLICIFSFYARRSFQRGNEII